jgi:hypothetical protein
MTYPTIVIRTCTLCDRQYLQGQYAAHAEVHTPVRKGRTGPKEIGAIRIQTLQLLEEGVSQSEIARRLGVSRQRVHQIAHLDELGRSYGNDYRARYRAKRNGS